MFELWEVYHKYLKVVWTNQKYKYLLFFQLNYKATEHAVSFQMKTQTQPDRCDYLTFI